MAENEALAWLEELGYEVAAGPDLAPDGQTPERRSYKHVVLEDRLGAALNRLNPELPRTALEIAASAIASPGTPGLYAGNYEFHTICTTPSSRCGRNGMTPTQKREP